MNFLFDLDCEDDLLERNPFDVIGTVSFTSEVSVAEHSRELSGIEEDKKEDLEDGMLEEFCWVLLFSVSRVCEVLVFTQISTFSLICLKSFLLAATNSFIFFSLLSMMSLACSSSISSFLAISLH